MKTIKIYNKELAVKVIEDSDIQIYPLKEAIDKFNWLDSNGNPQSEFISIIKFLDKFAPIDYKNNPKIWDIIDTSDIKIYNKFFESGENE